MERSFKREVQSLRLGAGETFHGEGILAVTKALLQSGVSYVGGYQGAPVSHLLDVMVEAQDLLAELGVHVETCTNEASAAAMLGASINYPLRGAVTWKSVVGTNVAADALSNLSSPGVVGGALIIIGEDYGEGASVIQERSYAYAMKSSMWLLDPRPDLPTIVRMVEKGFELSEASHAPVMLELRIRACHATGAFDAKDNRKGEYSALNRVAPARFNYARLSHPPVTFVQEKRKVDERMPAARAFIREHKLNEFIAGDLADTGIIVMGGLTNSVLRALERLGLADLYGVSRVPVLILNVVYPLVPEEIREFCAGKSNVLVVEEGHPDYIEQAVNVELRRGDFQTRIHGKDVLPNAGEYTSDVLLKGLAAFIAAAKPRGLDGAAIVAKADRMLAHLPNAAAALGPLPPRPPAFCTGCPERPVFSALKLVQRELGPTHISADIGCHSFATFAPFSMGNSILGYGMSLASAAAVGPNLANRPISIMGDGGFWHNGVITGVASNLFNKGDGVLIVMQNGYTSATGQQFMPSSLSSRDNGPPPGMDIEKTLRSMGVTWLRKVRTYSVATMMKTLKEAMRTAERGLKVIIADGECQLARQRRVRAQDAEKLKRGERVVRARYGVDEEICTGDHSCIRLSGCPSLTVKPSPDPLRTDPVATVIESCVGCGLCGEVAHAAVLCPSFYRAEIVRNPTWWDRALFRMRQRVIGWLGGSAAPSPPPLAGEGQGGGNDRSQTSPSAPSPTLPRKRGREDSEIASRPANENHRPLTLLIAALGGEGGGVLTDWIVSAALQAGFAVQSTSIPGVAQRTGATTYYIEIVPQQSSESNGRRPVLALAPGVGDVDIAIASELLESGRTVANGFVTRERTFVIASTSRFYAMDEKIAMGDGRFDQNKLIKTIEEHARETRFIDMAALARQSGSIISAVMLGAIAASGRLPIAPEAFEAAIRADGKAVDSNLRGFRAGLEAARANADAMAPSDSKRRNAVPVSELEQEVAQTLPANVQPIAREGVRRLAGYQDVGYARIYLDRLASIGAADDQSHAGGRLLAATARHLAVRMSYEDVIRVAAAKIAPERMARIAREELRAAPNEPYTVHDFLKPGIEELCQILPAVLARPIMRVAARRGWLGRVYFGMEINATSISGYLRFLFLARLKRFRPYGYRYGEEQEAIAAWLDLIVAAARVSPELGIEVAECARLIKGYGNTHARGSANYRTIVARVVEPALGGHIAPGRASDALASARTAALIDPDGESLAKCLAALGGQAEFRVAAE